MNPTAIGCSVRSRCPRSDLFLRTTGVQRFLQARRCTDPRPAEGARLDTIRNVRTSWVGSKLFGGSGNRENRDLFAESRSDRPGIQIGNLGAAQGTSTLNKRARFTEAENHDPRFAAC